MDESLLRRELCAARVRKLLKGMTGNDALKKETRTTNLPVS